MGLEYGVGLEPTKPLEVLPIINRLHYHSANRPKYLSSPTGVGKQ